MWPFSKPTKPHVEEVPWSVASGSAEDGPIIIRYRSTAPPLDQQRAFPNRITITWSVESPVGGMPPSEENETMNEFEALLDSGIEGQGIGISTAVITGGGVKTWQWYASEVGPFMAAVNASLVGWPCLPLEFAHEPDPGWSAFTELVASVSGAA